MEKGRERVRKEKEKLTLSFKVACKRCFVNLTNKDVIVRKKAGR